MIKLKLYDIGIEETIIIDVEDVNVIEYNGDNILIENVDGLYFITNKIEFING